MITIGKYLLLLIVLAVLYLLWYAPPLIETHAATVSYSSSGQVHNDAIVYRPLFMPSRYYIRLSTVPRDEYHWFAVDFSRRTASLASPIFLQFGEPFIHRDMPIGVSLTNPKVEDRWTVSLTATNAIFSNGALFVSLTKK